MKNAIKETLESVNEKIQAACMRSGRQPDEITLIAVSKTFPPEVILQAYNAGIRIFGENRPQELRDKATALPEDIDWHFIGHLQTNKIKYVVPTARLVHSVDSLKLAEALEAFAAKKNLTVDVLLEVNTSGEISKFGFKPQETLAAMEKVMPLNHLNVRGLMTIGPLTEDRALIRAAFASLRDLAQKAKDQFGPQSATILSMGMSGDFEIAIEEGATHIRLGSAIFGQRGK